MADSTNISVAEPLDSTAREEIIQNKSMKQRFRLNVASAVSHYAHLHSYKYSVANVIFRHLKLIQYNLVLS